MKEVKKNLVTVCVITYNHEPFIAKSIQYLLNQVTNFYFEIVIGEDVSTDKTREICDSFAASYPNKIKLLKNEVNLGVQENLKKVLSYSNSKYIALCEGDDFWIDPMKLQMQIDFLENRPDYSLCSTRYEVHNTATGITSMDGLQDSFKNKSGIEVSTLNMFDIWVTKTCTVVYRASTFNKDLIDQYQYFRDTHLFYHILKNGKGFCLNVVTCSYNVHEQGIWSSKNISQRLAITLKIFEELFRLNKSDADLKERYSRQLMYYIDNKIINRTLRTLFNGGLLFALVKYAFLKNAPGVFFLKYKQILKK